MTQDIMVERLKQAGWADFSSGDFLGISFDQIGKAKITKNNWFVLVKFLPVFGTAELQAWNDHYLQLLKQARAGFFTSGKFFILLLLADKSDGLDLTQQAKEGAHALLKMPGDFRRGGGYALIALEDQKKIHIPLPFALPPVLGINNMARKTYLALEDHQKGVKILRVGNLDPLELRKLVLGMSAFEHPDIGDYRDAQRAAHEYREECRQKLLKLGPGIVPDLIAFV